MNHPFEYEIIYSSRKTIAIQVTRDGRVLVRSPRRCSRSYIDTFISENERWVLKHLARTKELKEQQESLLEGFCCLIWFYSPWMAFLRASASALEKGQPQ